MIFNRTAFMRFAFLGSACIIFLASVDTYFAIAADSVQKPASAPVSAAGKRGWGTYLKPFAANSLWNSRPVAPVLGDFVIPKSQYSPLLEEGTYSTGAFLSKVSDGPMTVAGEPGSKGVYDADSEVFRDITIPHWPADVRPAEGGDGHAEIVDPVSGIVHSFWQLRYRDGRWSANQYAWTRLDGRGWPDPAHYYQGARAAAVSSMAGLIRKNEVDDGDTMYRHALALSMTFNGLAAKPAYVFPATAADKDAATTNSGAIPEGALLMLPSSFDTQQITTPALRKVAQTLKSYGAYVIDRNGGAPYAIYVENGSNLNMHKAGWNNAAAADLDLIRQALRQVVSTSGWIDGDGNSYTPDRNLNLLSMRGVWWSNTGPVLGIYDTWAQAVVFPKTAARALQSNTSFRNMQPVSWAMPAGGTNYRLTAIASGGAKLRFQLLDKASGKIVVDSNELGNGQTATFIWPQQPVSLTVQAISGVGEPSSVRGNLVKLER